MIPLDEEPHYMPPPSEPAKKESPEDVFHNHDYKDYA